MENHEREQRRPAYLKRKLMAALSMLLVSSILMGTTTYAWLIMSTAPEVTGITTNVGANGSLEIALLNSTTRQDLSQIRTTVGDSLANRVLNQDNLAQQLNPAAIATANNTWGNLIDLGYPGYGLGEITLLPTRLNVAASGEGYRVNNGLLSVPVYGFDGRIMELEKNTYSATFDGTRFAYDIEVDETGKSGFTQGYGVRGIGTSNSLSAQAAALSNAIGLINTYTNSAGSAATSALDKNGNALSGILLAHVADSAAAYGQKELDALKALLNDLDSALTYVDLAIRQGMVAVAASEIADETLFEAAQAIINANKPLAEVVADLEAQAGGVGTLPEEFTDCIDDFTTTESKVNVALAACTALEQSEEKAGVYEWTDIRPILGYIMDTNDLYIGEDKFDDFDMEKALALVTSGKEIVLTLGPYSGVPAEIATFTGDLEAMIDEVSVTYDGATFTLKNITIMTVTAQNPTYLGALWMYARGLEAAGEEGTSKEVILNSTYGYALDMAFRCNAATSDLLLQTTPVARVSSDDVNSPNIMGGGSYMEFSTESETFTLEQMIYLMDAIRVGFLDDQGNILGIAKLNTSNRVTVDGTVKAPLYLYGYEFVTDETSQELMLVMGERQKIDNVITPLTQNVAKAVTTLVWLDGDIVDNTMVAADASASLTGVLNLQFASSADLIPAHNNQLLTATTDKSVLYELIQNAQGSNIAAGQGMWTTESWDAYKAAYAYAVAVNANENANDIQVYNASLNLMKAAAGLEGSDKTALAKAISDMRAKVGTGSAKGCCVVRDDNDNLFYVALTSATGDNIANEVEEIEIKEVDYRKNLFVELDEEGNEVYEPIYTDSSWNTLAQALYNAEAVYADPRADYPRIDAAITALAAAEDALERNMYFTAYDLNGKLYYYGIHRDGSPTDFEEEEDTYGKWYDSDFNRVVADKTILELEARGELAEIAEIEQDEYVGSELPYITPFVNLLDEFYTELTDEEILAMHWLNYDEELFCDQGMSWTQINKLIEMKTYVAANDAEGKHAAEVSAAEKLLNEGTAKYGEAQEVVEALEEIYYTLLDAAREEQDRINDRIEVLTVAINAAKDVDGYDEPEGDEETHDLTALREAVADAEEVLAKLYVSSIGTSEADAVLHELNIRLGDLGERTYSISNTVLKSIPVTDAWFEVVYKTDFPDSVLYLAGETGQTELGVVILTKSGIIYKTTVDLEIYSKAGGVEIEDGTSKTIDVGGSVTLTADLIAREVEGVEQPIDEEIKSYTWASDDTAIVSLAGANTDWCTVTGKAGGTAKVTVTVETVQGNTYTSQIVITVNTPAEPAEPTT